MRAVNLDRTFFDKIDTEDKAYILGMLFADGSVTKKHLWILELHEQDAELLYQIAALLGLQNVHLCTNKKWRTLRLNVSAIEHVDALIGYGCVRNKTYANAPVILPDEKFHASFWRGFCDGDGSIANNPAGGLYSVSFALSIPDLKEALLVLADKLLARYSIYHREHVDHVVFTGPNAQRVARFLYQSSGLRLKRKEETAKGLMERKIGPCVRRMYAPEGKRWCNMCLTFKTIGEFYHNESRCKGCNKSRGQQREGKAQVEAANPKPPETMVNQTNISGEAK